MSRRFATTVAVLAPLVLGVAACRQDMHDAARYKPYAPSTFFGDARSSRPLVEGTVARGQLYADEHRYTGKVDGAYAPNPPFPVTRATLERGRERFDVYCTPCHGTSGKGDGPVSTKFVPPADLTNPELHKVRTDGYWESYLSMGGAVMPSYGEALTPEERWAVVNYVRTLAKK